CKDHFDQVQTLLKALGVPFTVNERLVRGLDYYTKTAFEIMVKDIGAQSSICGGGRYNGLVGELGGEDVPGIGFALGLERTILTMEKQGVAWPEAAGTRVFVAVLGTEAREQALVLTQQLRSRGLAAETDLLGRSLKAQLKQADRLKVSYTVIVGGDELQRGEVQLRSMSDSSQQALKLEQVVDYLTEKLKP
ncbi:MAG: histidine--tRNA ligase, partial [Bacillota bacterium]